MVTNTELLKPLNDMLVQARELVHLGHIKEWKELEIQTARYYQRVAFLNDNTYLQALNDAHLALEAKGIIADILQLTSGLDVYATSQRDAIASELRHFIQADKALNAYSQ